MPKKSKQAEGESPKSAAEYYKLNTKAVEELVTADASNSPKVSPAELRKYRSASGIKLPAVVKALLIKIWFAGMVCFFFLWGLGIYIPDQLDQLVIVGLALGFVTDILTNNVFHFIEKTPRENDRWMMFPARSFLTLPCNILYAFLILACVVATYGVINRLALSVTGASDTVPLGVGPILFGVFATAWDMLFITMKHTLSRIITDAKQKQR